MKLLIVSLDNIGDCVMASGFVRAIKTAYPQADITLWTKKYAEGILPFCGFQGISCDPFWDKSPGGKKGNAGEFLRTLAALRTHHFDTAFVLHTNWKKTLSCHIAGIKKIYGFSGKAGSGLLTKTAPPPDGNEHLLEAFRRLAKDCGYEIGNITCELKPSGKHIRFAKELASRHPGNHIILHPLSGGKGRNWPMEKYVELGQKILSARQDVFLWLWCSSFEKEILARQTEPLLSQYEGRTAFTCDEAEILEDGIALLSGAKCFAGNDSGPLHCASALGIPSVGIFLPDKKRQFAPRGALPPVILENESPAALATEDVFRAVSSLLPGPGPL